MATHYYTASSMDGFIADDENSLEWLFANDIDQEGPMGYPAFMLGVGALAMGATTYEWLVERFPGTSLYEQPIWVFTHRTFPTPPGDVRFVGGDVVRPHADMVAAAGDKNVWVVGGGDLAGQFSDAGVLDEIWVQYAPVALGSGSPVLPRTLELTLLDVARNRDFCCARYAVGRMRESSG